jgi:feruloyl esterase
VVSDVASDKTVVRQRPLCEYPTYPRYRGTGDANAAASFACVSY